METPRRSRPARAYTGLLLVGSALVTLAMYALRDRENVRWLLAPFRWLHIYVHEFGHGIAALLAGGTFDHFELYSYSGVALTSASGDVARAFVCAGGLCGPAVIGGVFLACGRSPRLARLALGAFGAFMALSLLLWTRTAFGLGFGAVVAAVSLGIAVRGAPWLSQAALVFLGVQLALSVYTGGGYLFTPGDVSIQSGYTGPSDVQAMANAIGGTYWLWGALCAAFSVAVLVAGLWAYLLPGRAAGAPKPIAA
jgi:hypothetical protein